MKTDPERTLAAVRAMGYDDVELLWSFDNFGRTPEQVHATLKHERTQGAVGAHRARGAAQGLGEESRRPRNCVGHQYLIVPSLPDETKTSLDAWRRWADRFNAAGDLARRAGIWLAFHNEPEHDEADRRRGAVRPVHRAHRSVTRAPAARLRKHGGRRRKADAVSLQHIATGIGAFT